MGRIRHPILKPVVHAGLVHREPSEADGAVENGDRSMNRLLLGIAFGSALLIGMGVRPAMAQHGHGDHDHAAHAEEATLPNCPIMGEPINLAISVATDDGPVFFCCKGCIAKFEKNPEKYAAEFAEQRKALAHRAKVQVTCPVTEEPVDKKFFVESDGKKVYVCCKGCVRKYERDPAKYASALANSYTFQTKCPVMGGEIDPTVFTQLPTGETIYYCCAGCDKPLRKNPAKYNKSLVSQGITINWAEVKKAEGGDDHDGHDHGAHDHGSHGYGGHDHGGHDD